MRTLLKNAVIVNVFTDSLENGDIYIEDDVIIGVGDYKDIQYDKLYDLKGAYVCPGFIDGHIHIESTMLTPANLARVCLLHGTSAIIADPHEIANVCGDNGIAYMLEASEGLPMRVYIMLPSCVPSTSFDESGAILKASDISGFYKHPRVLGLAEVMNYPGVLAHDKAMLEKIDDCRSNGGVIDGHAPFLTGKDLDRYISCGIQSDHECTNVTEAIEKIKKGQWVMIREGTAARNLDALMPLFDEPLNRRCLLVTDDRHPADLVKDGHIDNIIRKAVKNGASAVKAIRIATLQAAQCFGLRNIGAIAPGYKADLLVLNSLDDVDIRYVFTNGKAVVQNGILSDFEAPETSEQYFKSVMNSFYMDDIKPADFYIEPKCSSCRIIKILEGELITDQLILPIDWKMKNGIDTNRDILKIAVLERHLHTGHKGLGFINGVGLKDGAIASSVSHDSHNLVVIGADDVDMSLAANCVKNMGGGCAIALQGNIIAKMPLPIGGLMTDVCAKEISRLNLKLREEAYKLSSKHNIEPFMNMAFVSLAVIPHLKLTTGGLVDVDKQEYVSLYVD